MIAIDTLLVKIMSSISDETKKSLPKKDLKVLTNLSKSVLNASFITEAQSKLLIKILSIHKSKFSDFLEEIEESLKLPKWSLMFRVIDETRRVYSKIDKDLVSQITIECHYSNEIKQALKDLSDTVTLHEKIKQPKTYTCALTESNLVQIIEKLQPLSFDIQDILLEHYDTIKSWENHDFLSQFFIENITNTNFLKKFSEENSEENLNELIVADRRLRYQYVCKMPSKNEDNLTNLLVRRQKSTIWVDKKKFSLDNIFESLLQLNRLPVMIVFDSHDSDKCYADLKKLSKILEKTQISDNVGIYFRLDNEGNGKSFNQFISEKKYNSYLNDNIKVVGIQNGKIPKFFLKNDWKPMSVITLSTYLKNSKTAVYADTCDLIVVHTENEPLDHTRYFRWQ